MYARAKVFALLLLAGIGIGAHRAANGADTAHATYPISISDADGTRIGNQSTDSAGLETQIWDHSGRISYAKTASMGGYQYTDVGSTVGPFATCYYQPDANGTFSNHPVTCTYQLYSYSGSTETVLYQTTPAAVVPSSRVVQGQNLNAVWSANPVRFRLDGYWIHPTQYYPEPNTRPMVYAGSAWTDDL